MFVYSQSIGYKTHDNPIRALVLIQRVRQLNKASAVRCWCAAEVELSKKRTEYRK